MSGAALCTDASALLPASEARTLGVHVVPVPVALEAVPFGGDEEQLDRFYERLLAGARATTSQPGPGDFLRAYARAAASGATEVLSIHLDGALSGTAATAALAAREAPVPVRVVETETASFGVAVCVRAAARALAQGASAEEAARAARRMGATLRNVFVAPGAPGGRVGPDAGWTVLEVRGAATRAVARCRDAGEAVAAMAEEVAASAEPVHAAVGHAAASSEPAAAALAASLAGLSRVASVERYRIGAAVGAHTGPHAFGAFWWPAAS